MNSYRKYKYEEKCQNPNLILISIFLFDINYMSLILHVFLSPVSLLSHYRGVVILKLWNALESSDIPFKNAGSRAVHSQ